MPFWHRTPAGEDKLEQQQHEADATGPEQTRGDQVEDLKLLASGGIPATARARLKALKGGVASGGSFSGDLSPSEIVLLRAGGYSPLGLVGGSAMYYVSVQRGFAARDGELGLTSRAYNHASELAVGRMAKEARELRAHGVVGVRFSLVRHEWGENCVEVRVLGTAVVTSEPRTKRSWMSDLPGQDWWKLHQAGFEAAGLVYAHSTWFIATTAADQQIERNCENKEFTHFSNAMKQSRNVVDRRIQEMARQLDARRRGWRAPFSPDRRIRTGYRT